MRPHLTRPRRAASALVALGLGGPLLLTGHSPASADEATQGDTARMVLVLDSSGSMKEPAAGGGTKIEAAKAALTDVAARLPDEAEVGVRVFGAEVFSRTDPGACRDTQSVVPVGPLDRDALATAVADYRPYGETPIGAALQGAAGDLGPAREGSTRTIVLLSDGEPTCAPDPCQVARQLARRGIDLTINVVGLGVSGAARRALQCVAEAGNGTYVDASSAVELAAGLVKVSVRDLRLFKLEGERIDGGRAPEQALPVEPGTYVDTTRADKAPKYYLIDKPDRGGIAVSALVRPPRGEENWSTALNLRLTTPEGDICASSVAINFQVLGLTPLTSTGAQYRPFSGQFKSEGCATASQLIAVVTSGAAPNDIRLQVTALPEVTNLAALPAGLESREGPWTGRVRVPAAGPATEIAGGVSPDDAPEIAPDTTYIDTLRPGEQLIYKIPVEYGQAVRMGVRLAADPQADEAISAPGRVVKLSQIGALGQGLTRTFDSERGLDGSDLYQGSEPSVLDGYIPEVRVRNVEVNEIDVTQASIDGYQYFLLGMGSGSTPEEYQVPVRLRAEIVGEPSGEPEYADEVAGPGAGTPSASPTPQPEAAPADAQAEDGAPWGLIAAGAGLLLIAGVGAVVVIRRHA